MHVLFKIALITLLALSDFLGMVINSQKIMMGKRVEELLNLFSGVCAVKNSINLLPSFLAKASQQDSAEYTQAR